VKRIAASRIGTAGILPACRRDGGNPIGVDAGLRPACRLEAGGPEKAPR